MNDENAERLLVAAAMIFPEVIEEASEHVTGAQFTDRGLGSTFDLLCDLTAAGIKIKDSTVLLNELRKANALPALGGAAGVGQMLRSVPSPAGAIYHAAEINRAFRLRQLAALAESIQLDAASHDADPDEIAARMDATAAAVGSVEHGQVMSLGEVLEAYAADSRRSEQKPSVPSGIGPVDSIIGGFHPGELIVIGARTSIGKTCLGMQIAHAAAESNLGTLVVSLEMQESQIAQRVVASKLGIPLGALRCGDVTSADCDRIRHLAAESAHLPLRLFSSRRASISRIRGIAKATKAQHGLKLVVVDYLQLIAPSDYKRTRYEQVTQISNDLKSLAMELDVPVIALAQLNRQGEANDEPRLNHLRESGAIEQDSDLVLFLHRRSRESSEAKLIIAKNRQGVTGTINLEFDGPACEFREPSAEYHEEFAAWG